MIIVISDKLYQTVGTKYKMRSQGIPEQWDLEGSWLKIIGLVIGSWRDAEWKQIYQPTESVPTIAFFHSNCILSDFIFCIFSSAHLLIQPRILELGDIYCWKLSSQSNSHISWMWEKTSALGGNPQDHRENV